jgi:hypothetical protein
MAITDRLAAYEASRRRGVDFLLANLNADGSPTATHPERITYYRLPWALEVSGETAAASRVLNWIEATGLGPDGAFHGGIAWSSAANRCFNTYPETCLAYGAHLLRRFDIARKAMNFALSYQDPETGGVSMTRETTGSDTGGQLLFLTCQLGMSAVMTGQVETAQSVANWLLNVWEEQPELPDRLYTVWNRVHGLETEVPPGEDRRHYINESQEVRQFHFNGGIAAACLAHVHMLTGQSQWLELARAYLQFSIDSTPDQFQTKQVCKSAWGAGLLSMITNDPVYDDWLIKMGDWFVAGQESDGGWSNTPYIDPNPSLADRIQVTAEFVVHMDTLIAAVANVARRGRVMAGLR